MLHIDESLSAAALDKRVTRMWDLSAAKIGSIEESCPPDQASPVFTVDGRYTSRGWTEWTRGFQYGSALLQFDATDETRFLDLGRDRTVAHMAPYVSHTGVHDHGFTCVSTYGALWRLIRAGRTDDRLLEATELALRTSGAVQASRWQPIEDGTGYLYSFNGPHSLFVDTVRSCRSLALAHRLGHVLLAEHDEHISLLDRLVQHATTTATFNVFYGEGRDSYDLPGRVAHEALFNTVDGRFRAVTSQQGYSGFSTWTRGLAWAMLGFAELLQFQDHPVFLRAARATCDFYLDTVPPDGVPYWDTGAPGLVHLDLSKDADPYNAHEPVDSSAAAIAAQGLLRLGRHLGEPRYEQAGLTVARTLLDEPYLSADPAHQGLLLHSVYHRPGGWDQVHAGQRVPNGESSMWGDYHLRELALTIMKPDYTFFGGTS